ncbi:MAG: phosphoribosylglycinamide formyltransferase [Actinomycetes bacterium]|jgi:phosphoribosylglycinamide formyltransferase-1|nr:MAG: phosphoribosylglycinamide formyltransferase [Actinomycetota bacterium]
MIDIAVLASGTGTNLAALLARPEVRDRIRLVLSDRPGAGALDLARGAGVDAKVIRFSDHPDRSSFSIALADAIEEAGAKGVVLAGFMRILSPAFVARFPGRILNIHPSLLPAFPGARAVESALEAGVAVTGVTVHFVDEEVDHGPIVVQEEVPVLSGDDPSTLHARIKEVEHRVYPEIVSAFVSGRLRLEGERVIWG